MVLCFLRWNILVNPPKILVKWEIWFEFTGKESKAQRKSLVGQGHIYSQWQWWSWAYTHNFFFFFGLFRATSVAYGSSQARGQIGPQLSGHTTATATPDPSCICDLHHSLQQHQVLNPLSEARDGTQILRDPSWVFTTEPQQELQFLSFFLISWIYF